ncbi:MAG TPA: hypothetical protein VGM41_15475 [Chitinophagaceae bacterium]
MVMESDFDKYIFDFPLPVSLHGEELSFMVKAAVFTGGMFYTVRGDGMATIHIMCTYDDEQEKGTSHFTVMNEDTSDDAVAAAIVDALRQPLDADDFDD